MTSCTRTKWKFFSRNKLFSISTKKSFPTLIFSRAEDLRFQHRLIIYADHNEKQSLKIKKRPHSKKSSFNPFHFFVSLYLHISHCSASSFFWPGSAMCVRWWALHPGNKRVWRGSGAIVWCVFYLQVCLCGFLCAG